MLTARIGFDKLSKIEVDICIQLEIKVKVIPLLPGGSNIIQQSQQGRSFSNTSSSFIRCMTSPLSKINQLKERLIYKSYLQ
jgi:hypothetical protein